MLTNMPLYCHMVDGNNATKPPACFRYSKH